MKVNRIYAENDTFITHLCGKGMCENMNLITNYNKVKNAMLSVQRYSWEQGVCTQAMYEAGETQIFIAMAHDAVRRRTCDGRLAVTSSDNIAVTDPAANGEAVWRAFEHTGDVFYKNATLSLLEYYMEKAPRTSEGLVCHNEISFVEGYSPMQIWADSCYMLPPFLAVMREYDEAQKQLDGYLQVLQSPNSSCIYHIFDTGTNRFIRKKLWATGNGWALLGIARMIDLANSDCSEMRQKYIQKGTALLDSILEFQLEDGLFHDVLDDSDSFTDGTSAMMTAAFIYRGVFGGWLDCRYIPKADMVYKTMERNIDRYGIIRGVCGCPHFDSPGTSAEAQAAYIMMAVYRGEYSRSI